MIEILLFALIVYGLFNLMKGGVYFIKAVAKLVTAFYYIIFDIDKGWEKDIKKTPQYKAFEKEVDNIFNT